MTDVDSRIKNVVEAALLAAGRPLSLEQMCDLFVTLDDDENARAAQAERTAVRKPIRQALQQLQLDYAGRGVELVEVSSGWRFQTTADVAEQVRHLWSLRPTRYSRAMLETLALIAYRQPITRSQIEEVRGVSVSTHIVRSLLDFGWIRVLGHKDTPGRPMLYGTTRAFLDHFGLNHLDDLPPLADLKDLQNLPDELRMQLAEYSVADPRDQGDSLKSKSSEDGEEAAPIELPGGEDVVLPVKNPTATPAETHPLDVPMLEEIELASSEPDQPATPVLIEIPQQALDFEPSADMQWEAAEAALAELEALGFGVEDEPAKQETLPEDWAETEAQSKEDKDKPGD